jgi:hypothetical protein
MLNTRSITRWWRYTDYRLTISKFCFRRCFLKCVLTGGDANGNWRDQHQSPSVHHKTCIQWIQDGLSGNQAASTEDLDCKSLYLVRMHSISIPCENYLLNESWFTETTFWLYVPLPPELTWHIVGNVLIPLFSNISSVPNSELQSPICSSWSWSHIKENLKWKILFFSSILLFFRRTSSKRTGTENHKSAWFIGRNRST